MEISINHFGQERHKVVRKESLKSFLLGTIFSIAYLQLTYLSLAKWHGAFYVSLVLLIPIMLYFFIIIPITMLNRHNRTISKIEFREDDLIIYVFSALWKKQLRFEVKKEKISFKRKKFPFFDKYDKEGYLISFNNERLYLVFDYFSETDIIIKEFELIGV